MLLNAFEFLILSEPVYAYLYVFVHAYSYM